MRKAKAAHNMSAEGAMDGVDYVIASMSIL